jgi:hypothetical protein
LFRVFVKFVQALSDEIKYSILESRFARVKTHAVALDEMEDNVDQ